MTDSIEAPRWCIDFLKPLRIKTYKFVDIRTRRSVQLDLAALVKKVKTGPVEPGHLYVFNNNERLLPKKPLFDNGRPSYLVFKFCETERWKLVIGLSGDVWLTIDHYNSFIPLTI